MTETKAKVVFDQGHGNLVNPLSEEMDEESFSKLLQLLRQEMDLEIDVLTEDELTPLSLVDCRVFVFAAPTGQLTGDEIDYIWRFVRDGGGLLLLNNAEAFQYQIFSMNTLAERAGCRFGFYAAHEPQILRDFAPHYVSSSVDLVKLKERDQEVLSRVTLVGGEVELQPIAGDGYSLYLAVGTCGKGRIAVAGSTAMFSNKHLEEHSNRRLAANVFQWLAGCNPFDFAYVTSQREVELGQRYVLEVGLCNPTSQPTKIHEISLESSINDALSQPSITDIVLYPSKDGTDLHRLRWEIEPQDVIGERGLRMRIRHEEGEAFYQRVAGFTVVMPGHSGLMVSGKSGDRKGNIYVGEPFEVIGTGAVSSLRERSIAFTPALELPIELRQVHSAWPGELRWTLAAKAAGTFPIALRIKETGQSVQTHLVVREAEAIQIKDITDRFVKPLDDEILRILPRLSSALTVSGLAQVPFNLLTIEQYIRLAFPFAPAAQQVGDVVEAAYWDEEENEAVVADLLFNLAPMYMPRAGALVPFAPDLVSRLIETGTSRRRELLISFLKGNQVTDVEMRRRIAAYLSHEKYGHGFFYTCTKLGQQLAVLDKHRFLDKYAEHILGRPYPKALYDDYREPIKILQHSALTVNEGFSAWLELNILRHLSPDVHAIIPEREEFMRMATTLRNLVRNSRYFKEFPPSHGSPYEEARQLLESIQRLYPEEYGFKCAVQAFLVATAIPLGITDGKEAPHFALAADVLEKTLLDKEVGDARSDLRLWRIGRVLEETADAVHSAQERLQCYQVCLHLECPVRAQIEEKLGWRASDE